MTEPMIRATGLCKYFSRTAKGSGRFAALRGIARKGDEFRAVDDISFDIAPGEMVGYIGPNGAGKSTTIKMLTGILVPTSGEATVAGLTPWDNRKQLAQRIGVVFGQRTQLWWDLALSESLDLLRYMYRVPADRFRHNLDTARELLDLDDFLATPVRQLSLGQRMRGDLAASLLHDPDILYLDEPTIGLDIVAKSRIREFLTEINRDRGVTVLLTTHDLEDIERLCQRIMVIDHGKLIYDGDLERLKLRFGARRTLVIDFEEAPDGGIAALANGDLEIVELDGPRARIAFDREVVSAPEVLSRAAAYGNVLDLSIEEPEIETVIKQMYQGRTLS